MKKTPTFPAVLLAAALACGPVILPAPQAAGAPAARRAYSTRFPLSENPVSEGGSWRCGKRAGLDWSDIETVPGRAFGLESGLSGYDDATALLAGDWAPDQEAQATVAQSKGQPNGRIYEEVALRLRSSLSPHSATGYEIDFRCTRAAGAYVEIVRWDGPLGKFTYLAHAEGARFGVGDADVIRATAVGNVITAFLNGVQVAQATDGTYAKGSPGPGIFLQGATGLNRDYGFSSFSASEIR